METSSENLRLSRIIQYIKENKWFVFLLTLISVLYVLPIILANTYYIDDLNRTVYGYNWDHDGRFVSSAIMQLLSFQREVVYSLYPYSIMLSAVVLSLSGFILSYSLGVRKKITLFMGSLLLTTCPFLLEIVSYRFDCIPISLSILFITIPFLFYQKKWSFLIVSFMCLFLSFGLYQTTTFSYCIILCLFLIKDVWKDAYKQGIINTIKAVMAFVASFVLYEMVVKALKLELREDRRGAFIFGDAHFKDLLRDRYNDVMSLVNLLMQSSYRYVCYILLLFSLFSLFLYFKKNYTHIVNRTLALKIVIIAVLIGFILIFTAGINMFVYEPRWVPRAMIGWSVAVYLFYFALALNDDFRKGILLTGLVPFMYYSFVISSQLGVYLKNQDEFSDYLITLLSPKLFEHSEHIKVIIKGTNGTSHRNLTINYNTMPIVYKLAPIYENNGWGWGIIRLNKFNNISSEFIGDEKRMAILDKMFEFPIVDKNIYYTLRIKGDIAIIDFEHTKEEEIHP